MTATKTVQVWQEEFGIEPVKVLPTTKPLEEAWEKMGRVFGLVQLEKQKYIRAGLKESVVEINKDLKDKQQLLETKTIDLLGYPRLRDGAELKLRNAASSEGHFLNKYTLAEYKKVPPSNIVSAIMEAKQYFEEIEIWAVEDKEYVRPMKDPAVIGYVTINYIKIPYLIATWGDDIRPEDLADVKAPEEYARLDVES